ncbi:MULTISPECIES: hypothetical protein [unclassified Variovorax]|uniref:hypothetical protein n=1 Tax=unclassified Variovorax TaxID=663243 RepID=UPI00022A685F|nr:MULTISPECIES: hypothetical protein [unclassified Variovorax]AEO20123.1 hypothetical protein VASRS_48 [Variovorax sp. SRS16]VTU42670.1 hypothetical protein SRS16P1_00328 [Variovorax sp. SRS16]VTU42698.1 hypothetical protein E5P1_00326 [Variovorax sp. PBL-E5]VTU43848.1 hypothetical protein H6P1_00602 [Variovorax sp. PBL-H6]
MSQLCTFAGVRIALPNGWVDISDDMPEGTPPTLAKPEGVGALQFSVGRYLSGANPQVSPDDLDAMLKEFADTRSLGVAANVERGKSASHYVGGSFLHAGDVIRAWYLTNGSDVALVTYVAAAESGDAAGELADAGTIVRSVDFG